jgi:mannose/fructose/N-acetylgalactosamine-specific phosphotransferase system component IIB
MNVVLVRVDDRFIHGQILESWIPHLKAQGVIVANDGLAGDQIQKTIMSMAIPDRIKLKIVSLAEAERLMDDCDLYEKNCLVIVSTIKDAYRLFSNGFIFTKLNIGNNKTERPSKQLSYSVWVDQEDLCLVKSLMDKGVEVTLQSVPRERLIDMKSIIDMVDI